MSTIIDLRSDTVTQPTQEMRYAMANAEVGDDMFGDDPTVNRLEGMAAERFGKEAAVFVSSGVQGNLVSLMALCRPGDEILLDADAHIYYYEAGGYASIAGLAPRLVPAENGLITSAGIDAMLRPRDQHFPRPRLLCLENTHNRHGGKVMPLAHHRDLCACARRKDMLVHMDGARLFNASVDTGTAPADFAADVDTLTFCLSKGLSCPVGSVVVGDRDVIAEVRRARKRVGGAMRQAGILAAAGIVALGSMVERLAEDHANATSLAVGMNRIDGLQVDLAGVETNMVYADVAGLSVSDLVSQAEAQGIRFLATGPNTIRLVTHRMVSQADVPRVLDVLTQILGV